MLYICLLNLFGNSNRLTQELHIFLINQRDQNDREWGVYRFVYICFLVYQNLILIEGVCYSVDEDLHWILKISEIIQSSKWSWLIFWLVKGAIYDPVFIPKVTSIKILIFSLKESPTTVGYIYPKPFMQHCLHSWEKWENVSSSNYCRALTIITIR